MHRARRRSALAAMSFVALAAATACTATNPQTTTLRYDPADGQDVDLGSVQVNSLLVVAKAGTRGPGTLVGRLTNASTSSRTVTFAGSGSTRLQATFTVPGGASVAIGPRQERSATLARLASEPGGLVRVRVSGDGGSTRSVTVPVLTGTQPEFAGLVPTTAPPTTAAPTSSPAESGAATGRASSTSIRSSASASSNLSPSTRTSVASSPAPAAGSSAAK